MTRFARSKGSKSSNERLPNDPTPWHIMKQQLESAGEKKEPQPQTKSAKQLLENKEDLDYQNNIANIKTNWAEFDDFTSAKKHSNGSKAEKRLPSQNKKFQTLNKLNVEENIGDDVKNQDQTTLKCSENKDLGLKKKKLKRKVHQNDASDNINCDVSEKKKRKNASKSKNKEANNTLKKKQKTNNKSIDSALNQHSNENDDTKVQNCPKYTLEMAKNHKLLELANNCKNENQECIKNNDDAITKQEKYNQNKLYRNNDNDENNRNNAAYPNKNRKFNNRFDDNMPRKFQKNTDNIRNDNKRFHRKSDYGPIKLTINGMDVEIVKYDGFPVIKKDAKRLIELRRQMVLKGIPKLEIDAAMKLERRKCEKALTRIKKQVCFHCRKAGHNLSECPELEKEEIMTGICFKCGSTEHTHFECKVYKSNEYKFAKCFICREQGHIAKQCPDNPKGLYPDGGSCKICGDVTHLKKDCSLFIKQKEEVSITLDTIDNKNLELLDNETSKVNVDNKSSKKIVKF